MSTARLPAVAALRAAGTSRAAWAVLVLAAGLLLGFGSLRPAAPSRAARISALETEIKCPSCADLTIGQSDTAAAADLRDEVRRMVGSGASDAAVKAAVVAEYGTAVLEAQPGSGPGTLVFALPAAAVVVLSGCLAAYLWRRRRGAPGLRPGEASAEDEALVAAARLAGPAGRASRR